MGHSGIVMMIIGQYGANTLTVSNAVELALNEFEPLFAQHSEIRHSAHRDTDLGIQGSVAPGSSSSERPQSDQSSLRSDC